MAVRNILYFMQIYAVNCCKVGGEEGENFHSLKFYFVCHLVKAAEDKMSDLEKGMVNIITVFHKYSGHRGKLKKADLRALINNEMSNFIKVRFGI